MTSTQNDLAAQPDAPAAPSSARPAGQPGRVAADPGPNRRDVQRAALHDLVALATECAATEAELDRVHQATTEEAEKTLEKSLWAIGKRFEAMRAELRLKHERAVAEVNARYEAGMRAVREAEEPARLKAQAEHDAVEQTVERKVQQAAWLADSVLEVTQNQLQEEENKARSETAAQLAGLDQIQGETFARAREYGHDAMPVVAAAEVRAADEDWGEGVKPEEAAATFAARHGEAARAAAKLKALASPRLAMGAGPVAISLVLMLLGGAAAALASGVDRPRWGLVAGGAGGGLALALVLVVWLRTVATRRVRETCLAFAEAAGAARHAAQVRLERTREEIDAQRDHAVRKRDREVAAAKNQLAPALVNADKKRDVAVQAIEAQTAEQRAAVQAERQQGIAKAEERYRRHQAELEAREQHEVAAAKDLHARQTRDSHGGYQQGRQALERRLREGLSRTQGPIDTAGAGNGDGQSRATAGDADAPPVAWDDPAWQQWTPPRRFAQTVRFGGMEVDLKRMAEQGSDASHIRLALPATFSVPAMLAFPRGASMLVQADRDGRAAAIRAIQMVMARLLTSLPAGRVRFTILDPVGLGQNFAGFMHLADHDDALVGGRIWTEQEHIEQRLTNLTGHMETVIQKYLRNEFETIDDYNAQAGELAEPYRFLVVSDFPAGFSDDALRRLSSIASTGAKCGVYTLVFRDTRQPLPQGTTVLDELQAHGVDLVQQEGAAGQFGWRDPVFGRFPLRMDPPPEESILTKLLDIIGRAAKEATRVEVPFETIVPSAEQFWSGDSSEELRVPVGKLGATRLQLMRLGRGVAQHTLIAGKTGSGKSTLLHALVTNLAMWYRPDQVEFYLVDFKKGVEFKTYATHALPHARAIAVESDREFGLSVLQRLDAELAKRGEMFRAAGVQDLAGFRRIPGSQPVPRTLLIVDEFQEFFSEDDKLAQDSAVLIDRLVRQGRAFGIHVLLGSQTIAGASGLPRSTIGQMAVRIALQTSEADSQLILGDNNSAARLLSRPGEAIYNDQGGLVEGNSPFQIAWLPDEQRERYLAQVRARADAAGVKTTPAIVFEGNAPADISKNARLAELLDAPAWSRSGGAVRAWMGEPVAIKDPTAVTLRRQSGANLLIIGQHEEAALATLCVAMVSLAAQHPPGGATFYVLDATPADSTLAGAFKPVAAALPHETKLVEWRGVADAVNEIADEAQRRRDGEQAGGAGPAIYILIYGLQRYRVLRKGEDDFSFSSTSEEKKPDPGKRFAEVLREGPAVGVHVLAWADTAVAVERTLDRQALREFDHRVLFQMSANDSSNLIDSPAANKLGFHRALYYSEEQGLLEKFRPYAVPKEKWLDQVRARLTNASRLLPAKP